MSKFTPEPWVIDKRVRTWGIFRAGHVPNCHVDADKVCSITPVKIDGDGEYSFSGTDEQNANARLIAAAPTGYALLKRLGAAVMHMSVNHCSCRPDYECLNCHDAKELALYFEAVEGK